MAKGGKGKKPARAKPKGPRKLEELRASPLNPRSIKDENLAALRVSLRDLGDLSGIVWNTRTGELVTWHQRIRALREEHGDGLKLRRGKLVTPTGEKFPIRVVNWPPEKAKAAMLAANSVHLNGDWTDGLAPLLAELAEGATEAFLNLRLDELQPDTSKALHRAVDLRLDEKPINMVWLLVGVPPELAGEVLPHLEKITSVDGVIVESTIR